MKQSKALLSSVFLGFIMAATLAPLASAQVYPSSYNQMTLEDTLKIAKERVKEVQQHPGEGSGTPFLSANGVIGASIISGAVFGGIFVVFIVRAKKVEASLSKMDKLPSLSFS